MRIVVVDLHCNDFFVRHMGRIMSKNKVKSFKHKFLINGLIYHNIEVVNFVTPKGTRASFPLDYLCKKNGFFRKLESFYVEYLNELPYIKTIEKQEIRSDDIVIGYLVFPNTLSSMSDVNCYKLIFGNHFVGIDYPLDLEAFGANGFVNEIDLSSNDFVNKYINPGNADMLLLPYVYAPRFMCRKKHNQRLNKVMAVGTASTCEGAPGYSLYRDFFKTELIQPMRWEILEKKDQLSDFIDCYIGDIRSGSVKNKTPKGIMEKILWKFQSRKLHNQSDYTSFDMVETFNNYKMFVCPEELVGMPGIGAIEGMACGTAYIGIDHDMYKCLGLHPGVHYITYDGTLAGLIDTIKEYQNRPDDVERIAKQGMEYVRSHFNEKVVQELFIKELLESYDRYMKKRTM